MKKIWIALLSFLLFNALNAQGFWTPIDETEVPKEIVDIFHAHHPNARNTHWGLRKRGRTELYKVTAVEDGHHIKARYDENGTELEKIHIVKDYDKIPEPVKKVIEQQKSAGWDLTRAYHAYKHNKKDKDDDKENDDDDDIYKLFFVNHQHHRKHLHLEVNVKGKIIEKDYKKHSNHEVHF